MRHKADTEQIRVAKIGVVGVLGAAFVAGLAGVIASIMQSPDSPQSGSTTTSTATRAPANGRSLPNDPDGRWVPGREPSAGFHCSDYVDVAAPEGATVRMQACLIVATDEGGTSYRGLVAVTNLSDKPGTYEGPVSAAAGAAQEPPPEGRSVNFFPQARRWCFTDVRRVAHGQSLRSNAYLKSDTDARMTESPARMS